MSTKPVSQTHLDRLEKRRIASDEGAKAMAEREAQAAAVRQNMERLRALRLAREEEEAKRQPVPPVKRSRGGKTAAGKSSAKSKSQGLSEWLTAQRDSGHER